MRALNFSIVSFRKAGLGTWPAGPTRMPEGPPNSHTLGKQRKAVGQILLRSNPAFTKRYSSNTKYPWGVIQHFAPNLMMILTVNRGLDHVLVVRNSTHYSQGTNLLPDKLSFPTALIT